jgi:hypothetical protein
MRYGWARAYFGSFRLSRQATMARSGPMLTYGRLPRLFGRLARWHQDPGPGPALDEPGWNPARSTTSPPPAPALYRAAAAGLPALADPGYEGAGIGILISVRQPAGGRELDINTRTRNAIERSLRCLGERGFALLTGRLRTLQHITVSPSKIGDIARAALVLTHFEHGYIT